MAHLLDLLIVLLLLILLLLVLLLLPLLLLLLAIAAFDAAEQRRRHGAVCRAFTGVPGDAAEDRAERRAPGGISSHAPLAYVATP